MLLGIIMALMWGTVFLAGLLLTGPLFASEAPKELTAEQHAATMNREPYEENGCLHDVSDERSENQSPSCQEPPCVSD